MRKPTNRVVLIGVSAVAVVALAAGGTVYAVSNDSDVESVASDAPTGNPAVPVDDSGEVPPPPEPSETLLGPTKTEEKPAEHTHEPADDPAPRSSMRAEPTSSAVPTTSRQSDSADYKAPLESEPEPYKRPAPVTETMEVPLPDDVQAALDSTPESGEAGAIPGRHVSTEDENEDPVDKSDDKSAPDAEASPVTAGDLVAADAPAAPAQPVPSGTEPVDDAPDAGDSQPVLDVAAPTEPVEEAPPAPAPAPAPAPEPAPSPAEPVVPAEPATPSVDELEASLRSALAPGAPDAQIASAFEAGPSMIFLGRALADGTAALGGAVAWSIVGPVSPAAGGGVDVALAVSSPLGVTEVPITLVNVDGAWKISASSTPSLPGLPL